MNRPTAQLLTAILDCADGAPTIAWLVEFLERPHETVRRQLHQLRDAGLVTLFWSSDGKNGCYRAVATPAGRDAGAANRGLEAIAA